LKNRKFQLENQEAPGLNLRLVGLVAADIDLDRKTLTTKGKKIQKRLMKILGTMAKKTMKTSVFTMSPTSTK
jgi:chitinase